LSPFHWSQNTWPSMTSNGHFTLNFLFSPVCLQLWKSLAFGAWLHLNLWWMSANIKPKPTAAASRGFLAIARLSWFFCIFNEVFPRNFFYFSGRNWQTTNGIFIPWLNPVYATAFEKWGINLIGRFVSTGGEADDLRSWLVYINNLFTGGSLRSLILLLKCVAINIRFPDAVSKGDVRQGGFR